MKLHVMQKDSVYRPMTMITSTYNIYYWGGIQ